MDARTLQALAEKLFAAVERSDGDAFLACFAPDAVIVQNGGRPRAVSAAAEHVGNAAPDAARHTYSDIRRHLFDGGFVEEHTVRSVTASGDVLIRHACVVCDVDADGLVTQMREYIDRSPVPTHLMMRNIASGP
ncbi:nuclear transport factor 2 family protein [Gordonia aurantiaca]|uniref:nuclear transport factor 2 family protein n=1 Tax=Gordonia sp. B21 TaxID=3151852 RepID=UPI003266CD7C